MDFLLPDRPANLSVFFLDVLSDKTVTLKDVLGRMAPILQHWLTPRSLHSRSDRPENGSSLESGLDWPTARSLKVISLGFSSASLMASSLSIYWLIRMRRSFRHE